MAKNFIKNLLFEETEEQEKEKKEEVVVEEKVETPPAQQPLNPNEYVDGFEQILKEANLPGPDYLELKEAVNNPDMVRTFPDYNQRVLSAFLGIKIANPGKFGKETVLSSCDKYIKIIESERDKGLEQIASFRKEKLDSTNSELEKAESAIQEFEKKLTELRETVIKKKEEFIKAQSEFSTKEANFKASSDYMLGILKKDRETFNNILSND